MKNRRSLFLYVITFIISSVPACFYTSPVFEDGLGTMATAAWLAGHDWVSFLADDGFYYKYGQSFWYILPFLFIQNPIIRYKVLLLINSLLISFIPVIAFYLSVHYGIISDEKRAFAISLVTGLLPSALLYSKYTWAETSLFLIPWVIMLIEAELIHEAKSWRISRVRVFSALLAVSAVYAFMAHQRGIIVVIATVIMAVYIWKRWGSISLPVFFSSLVAGLAVDRVLTIWQKAVVYGGAVLRHNVLADFLKPEIYQKLFSLSGLGVLVTTLVGWMGNLICGTYGIGFLGLAVMGCLLWSAIRGKSASNDMKSTLMLQGLLGLCEAFALGFLFFFQTLYGYMDGSMVERADHLMFGRYIESYYQVLVYWGLVYSDRKKINYGLYLGIAIVLMSGIMILPRMDGVSVYVHSLMDMNLFMDTTHVVLTLDVIPNYVQALAAFMALSCLVYVIYRMLHKRGRYVTAYAVIICMELWVYVWNCVTVIGRVEAAGMTKYAQFYLGY